MSSWYVLSTLGFYPVNPAQGRYIFGSPLFDEAIINLENGKRFVIKTINNSDDNIYIQSVNLNGELLDKNYISHKEILHRRVLVYVIGNSPNKDG